LKYCEPSEYADAYCSACADGFALSASGQCVFEAVDPDYGVDPAEPVSAVIGLGNDGYDGKYDAEAEKSLDLDGSFSDVARADLYAVYFSINALEQQLRDQLNVADDCEISIDSAQQSQSGNTYQVKLDLCPYGLGSTTSAVVAFDLSEDKLGIWGSPTNLRILSAVAADTADAEFIFGPGATQQPCPEEYNPLCCRAQGKSITMDNPCLAAQNGLTQLNLCEPGECTQDSDSGDDDDDDDSACDCKFKNDPVCCEEQEFASMCDAKCGGFAKDECAKGVCEKAGVATVTTLFGGMMASSSWSVWSVFVVVAQIYMLVACTVLACSFCGRHPKEVPVATQLKSYGRDL